MSVVDVPDVFIGSTDDGHTFVALNRLLRGANRLLTAAGFTARKVNGRTVYLLPPTTSEEANERAGIAMYGLLAHTHDLIDLSWTTRWSPLNPQPEPDLRLTFTGTALTATATTAQARSILEQHGFTSSADGTSYGLAMPLSERELLGTVVRAETHAYANGIGVRVELGIPTPEAIPTLPTAARPPSPPDRPPGRHSAAPTDRR